MNATDSILADITEGETEQDMTFGPLTTPRRRQRVGSYDLEWQKKDAAVTMASFMVGEDYFQFSTVADMLQKMFVQKYNTVFFYAHSGGRHDMSHILPVISGMTGFSCECHVVGSRIILCIVRQGKNTWYLADSVALFKTRLEEIGDAIKLPKFVGDTDKMTATELYKRNRRDCEIVIKALDKFQDELWSMGGELKHTIGACAMTLFRRSYMKNVLETSKVDNAWALGAYHAARVEVLRHNDGRGVVRDINAAYPWAMTRGLPGKLIRIDKSLPDRGFWCSEVTVHVPDGYVPPLPFRHKHRIYFPTGTFRTRITRLLYELLYEYGGSVLEVHETHHYEPGLHELSHFAKEMYDKRAVCKAAKDKYGSMIFKYIMNTPYGKLAEGREKTGIVINPEQIPAWEDKICAGIYRVTTERDVPHAHTIAAVWITDDIKCAITRALWRLGDNAAYCDTDCTHGPDMGDPDDLSLGGMKREFEYDKGERIAAKLYALHGIDGTVKMAAKGFSEPTYEDFCAIRDGAHREYEWFATPREAIKIGKATVGKRQKRLSRQCPVCYRHLDGIAPCPDHHVWGYTVSVSGKRYRYADGSTRAWTIDELRTRKGL